ncbi:MAG: hypothetical protein JWN30_777, partial [Bacilli bacterium]|nr:hypothetical protein [Bacilli bacterium]
FKATGTIDAYLLYKEYEKLDGLMREELQNTQEEVAVAEELQ